MKRQSKIENLKLRISSGFTLIELLIVIAIIGVLAALLMANFVGVRQRGRDSQRKSDLRQIQSALELYRADQGTYPLTDDYDALNCGDSLVVTGNTYIQKLPCDPQLESKYTYTSDGSVYTIITCLENLNDSQADDTSTAPCDGTTNRSLTLQNP